MDSPPMDSLPFSLTSPPPAEIASGDSMQTSRASNDTLFFPNVDLSCLSNSFCVNPNDMMLTSRPINKWWSEHDQHHGSPCPLSSAGEGHGGRTACDLGWTLRDPLKYSAQISDEYMFGYLEGFQIGLEVGQAESRQAFLAARATLGGSPRAGTLNHDSPECLDRGAETETSSTDLSLAQQAGVGIPPGDDTWMQDWIDLDAGAQANNENEDGITRGDGICDSFVPSSSSIFREISHFALTFPGDEECNVGNERNDDEHTRDDLVPGATATRHETSPVNLTLLNNEEYDAIDLAWLERDEGNDDKNMRDGLAPGETTTGPIDLAWLDIDAYDKDNKSLF